MRILWVKVGNLWPLDTGGRLRTFHTIAELSARHELTLVTTHGANDDVEGLRGALPRVEVVSHPHAIPKVGTPAFLGSLARSWLSSLPVDLHRWRVPAVRDEIARRTADGRVDLLVADFLSAMPSLPEQRPVPTILFEHNVEWMIWQRLRDQASPLARLPLELEWRKMRRYEAKALRAVDATVAVSDVDARRLAADAPGAKVVAVPTGVDVEFFAPADTEPVDDALVFTGSMDWYPNEDAILHYADAIHPKVLARRPEARLAVVGRNPSQRLRAAALPSFHVTGTVDDVRPYVREASVYVVPLRVGGGTRLKIFEALAMGKAVVSTTIGAEGLPLIDGEHFVRADEPDAFADAVVALLDDAPRRRALGEAGRRLVVEQFSWPAVGREFERIVEEVIHAR